jgi:predicted RNA-binding Zn ribbon-like protein
MPEVVPEAPALVLDFVNTLDIESDSDELDSPGALRRWIERRMGKRPGPVDHDAWRMVVETRESLRTVLASHSGLTLDPECLKQLNRAGSSADFSPRWDERGTVSFAPHEVGPGALGRIFSAVVASQSDGTWERLKVCSAEGCRYAFYDHSKNRSGRWCEMRVCGNRAKTRTYRQRHG